MFDSLLDFFGYHSPHEHRGTVSHRDHFNAERDARQIHSLLADGGWHPNSTDVASILRLLCDRPNAHRQKIKSEFSAIYQQDLTAQVKKALDGTSELMVVALLASPDEYDAQQLHNALEGMVSHDSILVEIMTSRDNMEIKQDIAAYHALFGKSLSEEISEETSGDLRGFLVDLCEVNRDETGVADAVRAKSEAKELYKAGEKRWGTDEDTFFRILSKDNFQQLQLIFQEYKILSGHEFEHALKSEFSGEAYHCLLAMVKCVKNRPAFFAEKIHQAGLERRYEDTIRVIVSRSEKDMVQIQKEFQRLYHTTLTSYINNIPDSKAGYIKQAALWLIAGNNND